jgi:hypothetical protein
MYLSIAASTSPRAPSQFLAREALCLGVDGFELAAIDCDNARIQEIDVTGRGGAPLAAIQLLERR